MIVSISYSCRLCSDPLYLNLGAVPSCWGYLGGLEMIADLISKSVVSVKGNDSSLALKAGQ